MEDELLTLDQVADILKIHRDTARRYIREKKLKAVRLSPTNLRVRKSELERFIRERENGGDTEKPI